MATTTTSRPWQEIQAAKFAERESRIPSEWKLKSEDLPPQGTRDLRPFVTTNGILSEEELQLTDVNHDVTSLATSIAIGKYTSLQVVTAFCKRAAVGQQLCNNLTEIMFAPALQKAASLDEYFQKTGGKTVGPLHGIPMTFKECFHFKGFDSTNGYLSRAFQPANVTSPLPELLESLGAVIIAKTNVPQTMLVAESENNVFGRTKNPVISALTCGGSSGGEGSNIAFGGAPIGIGTDVGGSIRIPAAANGVYGYKPTFGILPMIGYSLSGHAGTNTGIPAVSGPLGRSVRDLALLTSVVRSTKPWLLDPAVIPAVFEVEVKERKPIVGVIYQSGLTPHPPIRRGVREAVEKLKQAGFEIRDFTPPDFLQEVKPITTSLFTLDGLSYAKSQLEIAGEPVVESVKKIGFWNLPAKGQEEAWKWNAAKLGIQKKMLDEWVRVGCDVVLAPVGAHTAVKPGEWTSDIYTVVWNACDYPAVVIPFTHADPALDPKDANFQALHEADSITQAMYDPDLLAGAPVALQIVGPRLGDAQLLRDVEVIDAVLNGK